MSISRKSFLVALLSVASLTGVAAVQADQTFDFNSPVVTGSSQAPGVWYTDRYAPAGFASPVFFDGDNRLLHSISAADGADNRPGSFSGAFYNTQGRKYDLEAATVKMSIDLYIPADWATTGARMAGFWGTAVDATDAVSAYPIVEFTSDAATPRFRAWEANGTWIDMGLPSGFAYDSWQTLEIAKLASGEFKYTVGDLTATTTMMGPASVEIANVILQGHNSQAGVSYDIHWDNLSTSLVPEPASLAMVGSGLLGLIAVRRRDSRA
jgi:hypothetical protein